MHGPDVETAAKIIADNVVSAYERERVRAPFDLFNSHIVVAILLRNLLAVLPTPSSDALAAACNCGLDDVVGAMRLGGPRVEAVDPNDGAVTIISA